MVMQQEPFPHDAKVKIELTGGGAIEVHLGDEARVLVPVRIRFDGVANSYCRLAVFDSAKSAAEFVPLPGNADHDNCRGMEKMAAVDLNHDGVTDLVFQVEIPSNRFDATVSEGAVYLSQLKGRKTYCYAPAASGIAASDAPSDPEKLRALIEAAVSRRGEQVLDCFSPKASSSAPRR
jgi:hypothetical protein